MKNKCICKTHYLFNPKTKSCEGMIFTKLVKKCQNPSNLCKACDINDFCLKCQKNSFYDEIHKECRDEFRHRATAIATGKTQLPGTCRYMMRFGNCIVSGCTFTHDSKWAGFNKTAPSGRNSSRGSQSSKGSKSRSKRRPSKG